MESEAVAAVKLWRIRERKKVGRSSDIAEKRMHKRENWHDNNNVTTLRAATDRKMCLQRQSARRKQSERALKMH